MKLLEDRILKDGMILPGDVCKVNRFLNHQMDITLLEEMGKEWAKLFEGEEINKILTIESSGIGIACIAARYFNNCPVVFAKKGASKNLDGEIFHAEVVSYTRGRTVDIMVSKEFLGPDDKVLIIDDFLASGSAINGLLEVIEQSGAHLTGVGVAVEKGFQNGGKHLRDLGIHLESLAIIKEFRGDTVVF